MVKFLNKKPQYFTPCQLVSVLEPFGVHFYSPHILITSFQKPVGGKLSQAAYIFDCVTSYLVMLAFKSKIKSWLDWNLIMVYTVLG